MGGQKSLVFRIDFWLEKSICNHNQFMKMDGKNQLFLQVKISQL